MSGGAAQKTAREIKNENKKKTPRFFSRAAPQLTERLEEASRSYENIRNSKFFFQFTQVGGTLAKIARGFHKM